MEKPPDIQDYTMDLTEAAAYQRWIRDGIIPERDYPWFGACKAVIERAVDQANRDRVSPVRRGRRGRRGADHHT